MLVHREDLEAREKRELRPGALLASRSRGRRVPEPPDPHRTCFARDRDRIVHSGAFRRLEAKTQVVRSGVGDNFRTRLTHSLEVAQIARSLARALGLNETFVETIALAHDLGHPPFGHSGEEELRERMADHGGFEHNVQALRIVDLLENPYPDRRGLNLCFETRESMLKHGLTKAGALAADFVARRQPWLEAQLVDLADSLAYYAHDLEDGLRIGVFHAGELGELELWQHARARARARYPSASERDLERPTIHEALQVPIHDLLQESEQRLEAAAPRSPEEARDLPQRLLSFSPAMLQQQAQVRRFLFDRFYHSEEIVRGREESRARLRALFVFFIEHPDALPERARARAGEEEKLERAVCDHIAGMTDRFAWTEHDRLLGPRR